jgi:hypothetical protein
VEVLLLDLHLRVAAITVDIEIVVGGTETPKEVGICGNDEIHGATVVLVGVGVMEIIGLVALVVTEVSFFLKCHPLVNVKIEFFYLGGSGGGRGGDYGNGQWEGSSWGGNQSSGAGWSGGSPGYGSSSGKYFLSTLS